MSPRRVKNNKQYNCYIKQLKSHAFNTTTTKEDIKNAATWKTDFYASTDNSRETA